MDRVAQGPTGVQKIIIINKAYKSANIRNCSQSAKDHVLRAYTVQDMKAEG
jgi:hypothetical protein